MPASIDRTQRKFRVFFFPKPWGSFRECYKGEKVAQAAPAISQKPVSICTSVNMDVLTLFERFVSYLCGVNEDLDQFINTLW